MSHQIFVRPKGSAPIVSYSQEAFEQFFGITYLTELAFSTESFKQKVQKNIPWLLRYTVLGYEQRRLGAYLRHKLASGIIPDVSIRWIDDVRGYGLFAEADFEADTFIGEYVGRVRQIKRFHPDINGYCMHYPSAFFSYNYFVIDAKEAGNVTRFMNHSSQPNLKPLCVLDRNLLHVVFYTTRKVSKGEELTFNYGRDYWRTRTPNS